MFSTSQSARVPRSRRAGATEAPHGSGRLLLSVVVLAVAGLAASGIACSGTGGEPGGGPEGGPVADAEETGNSPESEDADGLASAPDGRATDDTAARRPVQRILVLGDSLAAGYGLDPAEAFPALLQRRIDERGWPFEVVNAGISGDTSAGGLGRIGWLLDEPVDVLILELGVNDGLRGLPLDRTRDNLQAIVDRVRLADPDTDVVIAGMRIPPNLGRPYADQFRALFPELARANDARLVPFLLEGVAARPELNLGDGLHPNAAGQRIVAENVWRVLAPLLEERL